MKRGFSLVELSIVLVILGLLTGGVLAGKSLIRAAELRSVTTQFNNYTVAIQSFRDKYFALPGDMTNATSFWGDQATGTAACASGSTADGAPGTCNGNGDGRLNIYGECYRAWQQLATAGLIEGSYTGYAATVAEGVIGTNVPAAKMGAGGYSLFGSSTPSGYITWPSTILANYVMIGKFYAGEPPISGVISPEEAWNIDTKGDDGLPATGRIIGGRGFDSASCDTGGGVSATYVLTNTGQRCTIGARVN